MKIFNLKILFTIAIRLSGIPFIMKLLFQKKNTTVIYYHNIDKISFENHLKYLVRHYNIISINTLLDLLYGTITTLPPYSVLITIDDGHAENYNLLEIIKKYEVRPTIFLTTDMINSNKPYWFNLPFKSDEEKSKLKTLKNSERIEYINKNYSHELEGQVRQSLSWDEVNDMSAFVDFQSHTMGHPCLPQCTQDVMHEEIYGSKEIIQERTGKLVFAIAYPNGDFSDREINAVKTHGYKIGFSAIPRFVNKKTNPFIIGRYSMNDTQEINEFIVRLSGTWHLLKSIIKILRYND